MNLNALHRRLMQDVLEIGNSLSLVITGGYAVQAHQLVDRLSRDIDAATDSDISMETSRSWPGFSLSRATEHVAWYRGDDMMRARKRRILCHPSCRSRRGPRCSLGRAG